MAIPKECRYTKEHEWARLDEDNIVTIGITDYAQEKLRDIVNIEFLRSGGDEVHKDEPFAIINSTKASVEVFAPVSGVIIEVNTLLEDDCSVINFDPYEDGWIAKIEVDDLTEWDELLSPREYEEFLSEIEEE